MQFLSYFGFGQTATIRRIRRWLQTVSFHNVSIIAIRSHYHRHAKSRTTVANVREALAAEGYVITNGRVIKKPRDENAYSTANLRVRRDHSSLLLD